METTKIVELAKILKDNGLTKLDLTEGDNRLVLEAVSAPVACSASGWCSTLCVRRGSCGSRRYCMYRRIHEDVQ